MSPKNFNKDKSELQYKNIALGGTFDHFHKGHRHFLQNAFQISKEVTIGITSDDFANNIHINSKLQSFLERKTQVLEFLKKQSFSKRSKLAILEDPIGPTTTDKTLQALFVTRNTLKNTREINRKRRDKSLIPLKIIIFPLVKTADGHAISSQRIREGEISREGVVYHDELIETSPLMLPSQLRPIFRKPFGTVIPASKTITEGMKKTLDFVSKKQLSPIICVGDVVTHSILKFKKTPKLSIVDLRVQRKIRYKRVSDIGPIGNLTRYKVVNPAGVISKKLSRIIREALKKQPQSVIHVKGEEDLAVLPCILLAPLNCVVLYGHFQKGIVLVEVTEEKKSEALKLLQQLKRFTT